MHQEAALSPRDRGFGRCAVKPPFEGHGIVPFRQSTTQLRSRVPVAGSLPLDGEQGHSSGVSALTVLTGWDGGVCSRRDKTYVTYLCQ